jgi:glutamyl/glutaminyl-tRNA synthetase
LVKKIVKKVKQIIFVVVVKATSYIKLIKRYMGEFMSNTKKQVVTRMAPSPTGELHIGNLRTALYSWLYARQNNGTFILRIENTDRKRCKDEYTQKIINILKTMGLDWDLFYEQSHRLHIYWAYAHNLMIKNKAYICNCPKDFEGECKCYENYYPESANKLTNDNEYCIKLRVKELNRDIGCHDEIWRI